MSPVETWGLSIWEAEQYKKWGRTFFDPPFDGDYFIRDSITRQNRMMFVSPY